MGYTPEAAQTGGFEPIARATETGSSALDRQQILRKNRATYDAMVGRDEPLCRTATDSDFADPLAAADPLGWLGASVAGKKLLALAAGGGRQGPIYASAGADVTVVDLSPAMLELDREVARQRRLKLRVVEASMDDLSMLTTGEFDIVVQPVSSCYLPSVGRMFAEIARVTRGGGTYISQHKHPASLRSSTLRGPDGKYRWLHPSKPGEPIPPPEVATLASRRLHETGAVEFAHSLTELIGGMCRTGFVVDDLVEPAIVEPANSVAANTPNTFTDRASVIEPFLRIRATRKGQSHKRILGV